MEKNLKLVYFMHTGKNNKIHTMEFEITSLKSIVFPHYFHTISIMWKFGIKIRFPYQGVYSYIRVLPDGFLLKSTVFTVCKHEYMNIHPPPTIIVSSFGPVPYYFQEWSEKFFLRKNSSIDRSYPVYQFSSCKMCCIL
jgi:hypothetical protein